METNTDTSELIVQENHSAAGSNLPAEQTQNTNEKTMISMIADIASTSTDVDKVERLLDVQIKMMDRQAKMDFDQALARVQSSMPRIKQSGEIKNKAGTVTSRYMKYEDIDRVIRPLLQGEGFSLMHDRSEANGKMVVRTILKHQSGHEEAVSIPLPYDQPNQLKNAVQAAVSTFSYGKRVNVCSLLNIVAEGEDDDGQNSEACTIDEQDAAYLKNEFARLFDLGLEIDIQKFLQFFGVPSVDQLPLAKFEQAKAMLNRKEQQFHLRNDLAEPEQPAQMEGNGDEVA